MAAAEHQSADPQETPRSISSGSFDEENQAGLCTHPGILAMIPVDDTAGFEVRHHQHGHHSKDEEAANKGVDMNVFDEMTYKPEYLLSWEALYSSYRSVWKSWSLWLTMIHLGLLSLLIAVITILIVPDPAALRVEIFIEISKFLTVFCGLLLGFFMTNSVKRWHACATCFFELCDSIRNLQMQLHALGVDQASCDLCVRYGLLSGWILKRILEIEQDATVDPTMMLQEITAENNDVKLGSVPQLLPREAETLQNMRDPALAIWTWISSFIGRMAQDGEIPPMQTPTYGRIMNLCQQAYNGIRGVTASVKIRQPFVYVQMLTSLVHINNILNAIAFGVVVGVASSGWLIRNKLHYFKPPIRGNQNERDLQFTIITFLICAIGPLLYQALTTISISLSVPFANDIGRIPVHRILKMLEQDLHESKKMVDVCPKWKRAYFRKR